MDSYQFWALFIAVWVVLFISCCMGDRLAKIDRDINQLKNDLAEVKHRMRDLLSSHNDQKVSDPRNIP